ncbi:MAG: SemiSWEET transporter [Pedobacter agri]|uniref:SemiSWEET transporter n=1 Tax=Pedobacter agri TaxID=454586 RepID=A0A9X3DJI4_9SPHI|nr:SemiSWEET transporter [Pedobacter agri]MCX3267351.1 SemiSWEET transporter [Pedobacter agri]
MKLIIGITAGVLTALAITPQIVKTFQTKKAANVSPFMFIVLLTGNGLWFYYGMLIMDWPILITNAFSFSMDILMLILKYRYRNNH